MKNGCATIVCIGLFLYALSHPAWLIAGGVIVAIIAAIAVVSATADKVKARAAAIEKNKTDAQFLRTIPSAVLPAIATIVPSALVSANLPSFIAQMPIPSQNPLKYSDNVKALAAHVDYLDACQQHLKIQVAGANRSYASAVAALEKQQADLYRLAHRAAQNVAAIEARFPNFAPTLKDVATGWVPPKVPVPRVYSPDDIARALRWLKAAPTSQIAQAVTHRDWKIALFATSVTVAVKALQFQKIVREVDGAHHIVALSIKKAAAQRDQLSVDYQRVAVISAEVRAKSTILLHLVRWFETQEQSGLFLKSDLDNDLRRKLMEMASFATLARVWAGQAA